MKTHFTDFENLDSHIQDKSKGTILVAYRNCAEYKGMVLGIMIVFDTHESKYILDLQWASFGLDPYGDTLQESYMYQFLDLKKLTNYLLMKYQIEVSGIPINYKFDSQQFPDPLKNGDQKKIFENSWKRFQFDFRNGMFSDPELKLVYNSLDH